MEIIDTSIEGLKVIETDSFYDNRGYFLEAFNHKKLSDMGLDLSIYQENQAFSFRGAIRGLHYQMHPFAQAKLVRVIFGEIIDVAVDIRKNSSTFGKYFKILLTGENNKQLWIPEGFAHCALTKSEFSLMAYYTNKCYSNEHSKTIYFNDPDINIDWGVDEFIVSEKDSSAPLLKEIDLEDLF